MSLRKFFIVLGLVLVAYFVVQQPASAAQSLQNIGGLLSGSADSVSTFFVNLTS